MGWIGLTVKIVLGVIAALVGLAGLAYASDYGVQATVQETHCAGGTNPFFPNVLAATDSFVVVGTQFFGTHSFGLDRDACVALRPANFVVYHIRTGHTIVYQDSSMHACIYDSNTGVC